MEGQRKEVSQGGSPSPDLSSENHGGGVGREIPSFSLPTTLESPSPVSYWLNPAGKRMSLVSGKSSLQESVPPTPFPTTVRNKPKAGAFTGGEGPDGARDLSRASASEQQGAFERLSRREHDPLYVFKLYL